MKWAFTYVVSSIISLALQALFSGDLSNEDKILTAIVVGFIVALCAIEDLKSNK